MGRTKASINSEGYGKKREHLGEEGWEEEVAALVVGGQKKNKHGRKE